ncbi:Dipeptidyl aminopeptidase/acylaminoacyl peptidase [Amycolatopsis arida]|uniref:Dipeptidyl aminopeptidase/acylaminoacyl peptidase n=1 Tax=Amycolatopsis arida TaxID=587909 RepID=A0A1I5UMD3_9PSEU|nr:prolyl oligopeptidase family serine peptidase [Amycolatopsis arida]TDX90953.1 dipeptidyl aminopeptidase/acylaminoacyl peptidase [Amycolatopsis arida]SFP96405.1 Dipeptidyl aminopeptidase/acylaminoacyl peptidase [Amycolatopsis arida]
MTGLTAELVVDGRTPQTPALAPNGQLLCYVLAPVSRTGDHLDTELWLVDTDCAAASHRATTDTAAESRPRWSADSAMLFFLSDRADRGIPQVHRLPLADGAAAAVTNWRAGVVDYLPLADPNLVALLAQDEPTEQDARRARDRDDAVVVGEREPRARLRLLDLHTGRVTTPDVFGDRHVVELRQRPDGGALAVLTQASSDNDYGLRTGQLHLFDTTTGTAVDLGAVGADAHSLAWWPGEDGWHLGYIALTPPALQAGTAVFDLAVGSRVLRNRTSGLPMCPTELHQTDAAPLIVFADGLNTTLARLDPTGPTTLSQHPGRLDDLTTTPTGEKIAALTGTRYQPANVHVGPPSGPLRKITDTRPELDGIALGTQQPLAYRAADGLDLDGLLVLPVGKSASDSPFPLVTIVHGGPYDRYADRCQLFWFPSAQWLATAGYAVFLPNPRGGQGHGHQFASRVAGRVGQEEWTDILTGIDLLITEGVADPDRLGIAGGSHGGFMSAWAVGQTDQFRAALVVAGVIDWGMLAATGENGQFEAALGGSTGWSGVGPHPHDAVSPISFASRVRTPVLILHGAEDTNVPLGQSVYFHRALRHFGVEHEFVIYPREGHSIRERNHQLDVLRRTRAWLDRWLRP